jgi:hypothetical protein
VRPSAALVSPDKEQRHRPLLLFAHSGSERTLRELALSAQRLLRSFFN